ncbi:MAG: trypsin-like peptidase domain-containing protein [Candidatus Yanofskybacteria bacterium]|nr:trypsin-like peptidase domain-containing protein [Candidatus Yanofskybacteria bacterium]
MTNIHEHDKYVIDAVRKVSPSVVSIVISKYMPRIKGPSPNSLFNPFAFGDVEDGAREKTKIGGGSGFIVHQSGLVLTNKHVVFDADAEYTVITNDGVEYQAQVLSRDPINDIAILKINTRDDLQVIKLGNSTSLELGQTVVAIGNALGMFTNSVSKGIISGLARSISASLGTGEHLERLRGVIQTDVAINQGNSGGPLIDLNGEVIAINTAVIFGAQNIGFSIPINWAKQDLSDILEHGRIVKPYLGLMYVMLSKEAKDKYGLPVDHGALVMRDHLPDSVAVMPHSPADKAGIKENDIITELNGLQFTETKDLTDALQEFKVGEEVELTILRHDQEKKLKLKLEERKA